MSPLEQDQLDFAGRMAADPYFAMVGIYVVRPRGAKTAMQIQQELEETLNCRRLQGGKGGAAVQVLMPLADVSSPNIPGPQFDARITLRVQELPLVNMGPLGTGLSAEDIALHLSQLFHHWNPGTGAVWNAAAKFLTPRLDFAPKVTYDLTFGRLLQLARATKCATPTITPATGAAPQTVTLACATAGAALWYTLDGSYPSSANSAATLYSAPLALATACTLRVAAEHANLLPSDIARSIFT